MIHPDIWKHIHQLRKDIYCKLKKVTAHNIYIVGHICFWIKNIFCFVSFVMIKYNCRCWKKGERPGASKFLTLPFVEWKYLLNFSTKCDFFVCVIISKRPCDAFMLRGFFKVGIALDIRISNPSVLLAKVMNALCLL